MGLVLIRGAAAGLVALEAGGGGGGQGRWNLVKQTLSYARHLKTFVFPGHSVSYQIKNAASAG